MEINGILLWINYEKLCKPVVLYQKLWYYMISKSMENLWYYIPKPRNFDLQWKNNGTIPKHYETIVN